MLLATSAMNCHSMAAANIRIDGAPASQDSIIESPATISDNLTKRILETWSIDKLDDLLGHDRSPPHYSEHLRKSLWSLCRKASLADAQNWLGEEVALRLSNPNKRGKRLDFLTDIDVKNVLKNKFFETRDTPEGSVPPESSPRGDTPSLITSPHLPTLPALLLPARKPLRENTEANGHTMRPCHPTIPRKRTASMDRPSRPAEKYRNRRKERLDDVTQDLEAAKIDLDIQRACVKRHQHNLSLKERNLLDLRRQLTEMPSQAHTRTQLKELKSFVSSIQEVEERFQHVLRPDYNCTGGFASSPSSVNGEARRKSGPVYIRTDTTIYDGLQNFYNVSKDTIAALEKKQAAVEEQKKTTEREIVELESDVQALKDERDTEQMVLEDLAASVDALEAEKAGLEA